MAGPHVIEVGEADFESQVVEASRHTPVVVDFWAGWCRPCLVLGPVLEGLAEEHGGRFVLAKVDVDANPSLAERYRVQGIPAVKAFRNGQVLSEFVGAQPEQALRRFIDSIVPTGADERAAEGRAASSPEEAEAAFRAALGEDPSHPDAAAGLATLLLERGDVEGARVTLGRAIPTPEVRRLQSELDLHSAAAEVGELGAVARSALGGDPRDALERSLSLIREDGHRDAARDLMVRVFDFLGDEHPLTREYRPKLASALY